MARAAGTDDNSAGSSVSETELMHHRSSVGVSYPSPVNTCPRWESHRAHRASTRSIPWDRSSTSVTASPSDGS